MGREELINFYKGTNYKKRMFEFTGMPARPREWNMPLFIRNYFRNYENEFLEAFEGKEIVFKLDNEDIYYFRGMILHEALFDFYKAFYNYVSALKLYEAGALHWIEITSYYAKFYLSRVFVTVFGKQRYVVRGKSLAFDKNLYKLINPKEYNRIITEHGEFINTMGKYAIDFDLDIFTLKGKIRITNDLGGGGSHSYIWRKYNELNVEKYEFTDFTYSYPQHLSEERNMENYSFEGYMQLDFNIDWLSFPSWFDRPSVKQQSEMIYTEETAIVLGVISQLYHFFKDLEIHGLPTEKQKISHIADYMLSDGEQKRKLIDLVNRDFPYKNEYIDEFHLFMSS